MNITPRGVKEILSVVRKSADNGDIRKGLFSPADFNKLVSLLKKYGIYDTVTRSSSEVLISIFRGMGLDMTKDRVKWLKVFHRWVCPEYYIGVYGDVDECRSIAEWVDAPDYDEIIDMVKKAADNGDIRKGLFSPADFNKLVSLLKKHGIYNTVSRASSEVLISIFKRMGLDMTKDRVKWLKVFHRWVCPEYYIGVYDDVDECHIAEGGDAPDYDEVMDAVKKAADREETKTDRFYVKDFKNVSGLLDKHGFYRDVSKLPLEGLISFFKKGGLDITAQRAKWIKAFHRWISPEYYTKKVGGVTYDYDDITERKDPYGRLLESGAGENDKAETVVVSIKMNEKIEGYINDIAELQERFMAKALEKGEDPEVVGSTLRTVTKEYGLRPLLRLMDESFFLDIYAAAKKGHDIIDNKMFRETSIKGEKEFLGNRLGIAGRKMVRDNPDLVAIIREFRLLGDRFSAVISKLALKMMTLRVEGSAGESPETAAKKMSSAIEDKYGRDIERMDTDKYYDNLAIELDSRFMFRDR